MESQKDLDIVGALRRRWLLVVLLTVLGGAVGFTASSAMPPVYEGTASLLVGDFENGDVSNNEIQAMQSLTATYADIARREPVLAGAAKDLGLSTDWRQLRRSVHIRVPNESPQVIEISFEGGSREKVKSVAGAIAKRLVRYVKETTGPSDFVWPQLARLEQAIEDGDRRVDQLRAEQLAAGDDAPASIELEIQRTQTQIAAWQNNYAAFKELATTSSHVTIRKLDPAAASKTPVRPDIRFNTVIAGAVGLLLALAIVYLLESRRGRAGGGGRATDSPLTVPPGPSHATIPIHGRNVRRAGPSGRVTDHNEGEVR